MGFFGGSSNNNEKPTSSSTDTQSPTPDFSPPSGPLSSPSPTSFTPNSQSSSAIRQRLESAISEQSNVANARTLMSKIADNCFAHCVPNPGSSLSSKEQACLSNCMEKYIEAWNTVSRTYVMRVQREGSQLPMGGEQ